MYSLKEATIKEKQPLDEKTLAQRLSEATRQIQSWAKEAYQEAKAAPEFATRSDVPDFPNKRIRICTGQSLDHCTIALSDNPVPRPVRLWTNFGFRQKPYFYDLRVDGKREIDIFERRKGNNAEVDPIVRQAVLERVKKIFEQPSLVVSLERKIYSGGSPIGLSSTWQTLKTENLSLI